MILLYDLLHVLCLLRTASSLCEWRTNHYDNLLGHSDSAYSNSDTNNLWECDLQLKINNLWITITCWICLYNFHHTNLFLTEDCKRRPSLLSFGAAHPWVLNVTCLRPLALGKWGVNWGLKMLVPVPLTISR